MILPPDTVTVPDAMARLGVSNQTVWSYIKKKKLKAKKVGRMYWISRASLDALAAPPEEPKHGT